MKAKKPPQMFALGLSLEEAIALQTLLVNVGGSPTNSARLYCESIQAQLTERGVPDELYPVETKVSFYFADLPRSSKRKKSADSADSERKESN